ncbi:MAG: glutamine-hydrolyzing GMP synthase [Treponemataceae bacterium]
MKSQIEKIVIVDFGGQYSQLIARRVRNLKVYSEIVPYQKALKKIKAEKPIGIIFTGGANSVYEKDSPLPSLEIFELGIPVLGICYGMQVMAQALGGEVARAEKNELEKIITKFKTDNPLFSSLAETSETWMNQTDCVKKLPPQFISIASTANTENVAMANESKKLYAVQFHPELEQTKSGNKILKNFLFNICGAKGTWQIKNFLEEQIQKLKTQIGDGKVLLALSGGVDSSVLAALLDRAIGKNLNCIFVDTGLMRKNEGDEVEEAFKNAAMNFVRVNAGERYLQKLKGVTEPEKKRKIIGEEFIRIFEEEALKIGEVDFLAQGTIYADIVESGTAGSAIIKSHHNVGGLPKNIKFKSLVEPLRDLFKDEVRQLGSELGLSEKIVNRQPFPGPGLAIRIIGEITTEKISILQDADLIFRTELEKAKVEASQYFAVLTNNRTVGVTNDFRTYDYTLALRAVKTNDFMTASIVHIPFELLEKISTRIINEVKGINRIVYDITGKPPATIEWE